MQKIPRKYAGFVMGAMMAVAMGFIMSFVVTLINLGLDGNFVHEWMKAFFSALPVGFPVALVVTPLIKAFVDSISE